MDRHLVRRNGQGAQTGKVVNIAVIPAVEVAVATRPKKAREPRITIRAENYHDVYSMDTASKSWTKHPPIEAGFSMRAAWPQELDFEQEKACLNGGVDSKCGRALNRKDRHAWHFSPTSDSTNIS